LHADALVEVEKYCQALTENIKWDLDMSRLEDELMRSEGERKGEEARFGLACGVVKVS